MNKSFGQFRNNRGNIKDRGNNAEFALKQQIAKNKNTLTFAEVMGILENQKEDTGKFYTLTQLIKNIDNDNNIVNILQRLHDEDKWKKWRASSGYGLFHMASFIKDSCSLEQFEKVVKLLYAHGYDPFETNKNIVKKNGDETDEVHETAIMGLFAENNRLRLEDSKGRYKIYLDNFPKELIEKILNRFLNKSIWKAEDVVVFCLCVDAKVTMEVLAKNFLLKEYKKIHLGTINDDIADNIKFLEMILSEKNMTFISEFVKEERNYWTLFIENLKKVAENTNNENKERTDVVFVRVLGSGAKQGRWVKECNEHIFGNLVKGKDVEHLIHLTCHVGFVTDEMKDLIWSMVENKNSRHGFILEDIFKDGRIIIEGDKDGIYLSKKLEGIGKIPTKSNISGIREIRNYAKSCYDLYPEEEVIISQHIIIAILELITAKDKDNVGLWVNELINLGYLNAKLIKGSESYVLRMIKSNELDCSQTMCMDTWRKVLSTV